ncbi:MAG: SpoIID/LytB domain-containing protein [Acidobacteriota bacterium]
MTIDLHAKTVPAILLCIFFCLCATNAHADDTARPERLRIGLFNLLKPTKISLQSANTLQLELLPAEKEASTIEAPLAVGEKIALAITAEGLACRWQGPSGILSNRLVRRVRLFSAGEASITVTIPGKLVRQLPLPIEFQSYQQTIQTVIDTDEETAVAISTASELAAGGTLAVFKAQAIVVRSYLRAMRGRHNVDGYDLCDNTHCLLYYGEDIFTRVSDREAIQHAVTETAGMVLSYQEKILPAYFTASCGGVTALPGEVWSNEPDSPANQGFRSVRCSYCRGKRFYRWERAVSVRALWAALRPVLGFIPGEEAEIKVQQRTPAGFVTTLLVEDKNRQVELAATRFRHLIGVQLGWNVVLSNSFQILRRGRQIIFTGRGFGHNLGLCMTGAVEQARRGRNFQHILNYYFPGASLSVAPSVPGEKGKVALE